MESVTSTESFANKFVDVYCKELIDVQKQIQEMTVKQESVVAEIKGENTNLCNKTCLRELNEIHSVIRIYQHRLIALKKEMNTLQERSKYLKQRAIKLKLNKDKAASKNPQT